jgi:hypothetical protein
MKATASIATVTITYPKSTQVVIIGDPFILKQLVDHLDKQVVEYYD